MEKKEEKKKDCLKQDKHNCINHSKCHAYKHAKPWRIMSIREIWMPVLPGLVFCTLVMSYWFGVTLQMCGPEIYS